MNITKDRVVSIAYTLTDKDNQVIDSSSGAEPLAYLHGYENIIPGLEKALEGKAEGDSLKVSIPAAEAYGARDDGLVIDVPKSQFNGAEGIEAGVQFEAQTQEGNRVFTVLRVVGDTVTIDGNHPLAGMDLNFDVTVAGVREANAEEIAHGHPHHAHHHHHDEADCDDCEGCDAHDQ
ncbi:peptidyl-prolyl cis-trans isomerase [Spirochaetia bacterium]|nr:peptidyl-prolyl cis-trans isomerase [Spirochaetia bacterium]